MNFSINIGGEYKALDIDNESIPITKYSGANIRDYSEAYTLNISVPFTKHNFEILSNVLNSSNIVNKVNYDCILIIDGYISEINEVSPVTNGLYNEERFEFVGRVKDSFIKKAKELKLIDIDLGKIINEHTHKIASNDEGRLYVDDGYVCRYPDITRTESKNEGSNIYESMPMLYLYPIIKEGLKACGFSMVSPFLESPYGRSILLELKDPSYNNYFGSDIYTKEISSLNIELNEITSPTSESFVTRRHTVWEDEDFNNENGKFDFKFSTTIKNDGIINENYLLELHEEYEDGSTNSVMIGEYFLERDETDVFEFDVSGVRRYGKSRLLLSITPLPVRRQGLWLADEGTLVFTNINIVITPILKYAKIGEEFEISKILYNDSFYDLFWGFFTKIEAFLSVDNLNKIITIKTPYDIEDNANNIYEGYLSGDIENLNIKRCTIKSNSSNRFVRFKYKDTNDESIEQFLGESNNDYLGAYIDYGESFSEGTDILGTDYFEPTIMYQPAIKKISPIIPQESYGRRIFTSIGYDTFKVKNKALGIVYSYPVLNPKSPKSIDHDVFRVVSGFTTKIVELLNEKYYYEYDSDFIELNYNKSYIDGAISLYDIIGRYIYNKRVSTISTVLVDGDYEDYRSIKTNSLYTFQKDDYYFIGYILDVGAYITNGNEFELEMISSPIYLANDKVIDVPTSGAIPPPSDDFIINVIQTNCVYTVQIEGIGEVE